MANNKLCSRWLFFPTRLFLRGWAVWGTRSPPTFFLARGFQHGETCSGAKRPPEHGLCSKNTTEGSLEEDRKLNAERDAFGIPQQNTTETLFTLGDLPEAKGSRSGAYSPHTLETGAKQNRIVLWRWNIWPHHLSCPSLPLWLSILRANSDCASLAAVIWIYRFNSWTPQRC